MRILFVDDLPDTRDVFRLAFGIQGHNTRLASNGREAVDAVGEESFDAIIMDVEMPEMNGFEAVKNIRQLEFGRSVPIIMFTAYGDNEAQEKAAESGADLLLHKPILPQELLSRIEQLSR
jgi:CheY-like chemotaxis protein